MPLWPSLFCCCWWATSSSQLTISVATSRHYCWLRIPSLTGFSVSTVGGFHHHRWWATSSPPPTSPSLLMGDIIFTLVISPPWRLHQLPPMDNFNYNRRTSLLHTFNHKHKDFRGLPAQAQGSYLQFELFLIYVTWIHGHVPTSYAQRLDQSLFPTRAIGWVLAPVRIWLSHLLWALWWDALRLHYPENLSLRSLLIGMLYMSYSKGIDGHISGLIPICMQPIF